MDPMVFTLTGAWRKTFLMIANGKYEAFSFILPQIMADCNEGNGIPQFFHGQAVIQQRSPDHELILVDLGFVRKMEQEIPVKKLNAPTGILRTDFAAEEKVTVDQNAIKQSVIKLT